MSETWIPIDFPQFKKISIDAYGLEAYKGDEFYVWVKEEFEDPFEMEGVNDDIYLMKTYYLFSKRLKKYSILEIIFYDEESNVLTSYSYPHESADENYRYNYPIIPGSVMDGIFSKCTEYVGGEE
jgi:hypothetical protein